MKHVTTGAACAVALACLAVGVAGCATGSAAATVGAVQAGTAVYCHAITEEARQAVRDATTGGVRIIPCKPPGVP